MSVSDLNHFMTYVIEGWMLFSAGFIGTTFVSFVSRRIQEDMEAAALAAGVTDEATVTEAVEAALEQSVAAAVTEAPPSPADAPASPKPETPAGLDGDEPAAAETGEEADEVTDEKEAARLEEVAAVSEQLAKNRGKQSDSSSVSVST
ncbi:MAG: hypothetical protein AAGC93_10090 [Cyanobacteria bacterium P01_F01_bin.53]